MVPIVRIGGRMVAIVRTGGLMVPIVRTGVAPQRAKVSTATATKTNAR